MKTHIKHHSITVIAVLVVLAVAAGIFIYSGLYNIGADDHHTKPVFKVMQTLRDRSIETKASSLAVPADLMDPKHVVQGAGNYDAMCAVCHLSPGAGQTELSRGLYPAPPNLTTHRVDEASAFWVIKHGIKASGMPAWGLSMNDEYIWNMAAFLQKLPDLDADEYRALVASSGGHSHGGGETMAHSDGAGDDDHHSRDNHAATPDTTGGHHDTADNHHDAAQSAPTDEDLHEDGDGHSHGNGTPDSGHTDKQDHHAKGDGEDAAGHDDADHDSEHAHSETETGTSTSTPAKPTVDDHANHTHEH